MNIYLLLLFSFMILFSMTAFGDTPNLIASTNHRFFIENKGQWPAEVKFLSKSGGMNAWITDFGVVYDYYRIILDKRWEDVLDKQDLPQYESRYTNSRIKGDIIRAVLRGVNPAAVATGNGKQQEYYNYFIGKETDKWASHVGLYEKIEIQDVYPGIDIHYYWDNGFIRYDYILDSGANISQIQFNLDGIEGYEISRQGELHIQTSLGKVTHGKLRAYQLRGNTEKEVSCRFEQKPNGLIGIEVDGHDETKPLIIDPLVYSTFIGGADEAEGESIVTDNNGNVYVSGFNFSTDYPTTIGAYDRSFNGEHDAFVTKLNAGGTGLIYSTFIGGMGGESGRSITIDNNRNTYVTGYTNSTDFPTTNGAYDQSLNGEFDIFVVKLNAAGSALVYSTLIGGGAGDYSRSLGIDNNGNVYLTGYTSSTDFPTTNSAYDRSYNDNQDIFVTQLNAIGSGLVYSTYLGGKRSDNGFSIAIDNNGNAWVTGETSSNDFPTSGSAYQRNRSGADDVFIVSINANGTGLNYSTFIGGTENDYGRTIAIDDSNHIYVAGCTASADYPTTSSAYDRSLNGEYDVFVTKLNAGDSGLLYSSFLGGASRDWNVSIALDEYGNTYLAGTTYSTDFPTTDDAYDQSFNGGSDDVFIAKLNTAGSGLDYSTFLGGSGWDGSIAIANDIEGNIYVTGYTYSNDFPTTSGAYDRNYDRGDFFITKLNIIPSGPSRITVTSPNGGETWYVGTRYSINWEADQYIGQVKIEISTTGGQSWWDITQGQFTPNDGSYQYIPVVENISNQCMFRVTSVENPSVNDRSNAVFTIQGKATGNLIINGDFSNGDHNWAFYSHAPASATGSVVNGEYVVAIAGIGTQAWHVQLNQYDLNIENGKKYTVAFDAYASAERTIYTGIGKNASPYTNYSAYEQFTISKSKKTYIYTFTMTEPTDPAARIFFDMGLSTATVYLDNISLIVDESAGFWADVDDDGDVDVMDILLVAGRWNTRVGDPKYDPKYDVDNEGIGDGDIDVIDILLVAGFWNKILP